MWPEVWCLSLQRVGTQALGNVFTIAWDVYPVKPQMTTYILPFGEDLAAAPRNYRSFDRVDALLEATQDNTVVQLDFNQDGTWSNLSAQTRPVLPALPARR